MAAVVGSMLIGLAAEKLYDHFFPKQKGSGSKRAGQRGGSKTRAQKVQAVTRELGKLPKTQQVALIKRFT